MNKEIKRLGTQMKKGAKLAVKIAPYAIPGGIGLKVGGKVAVTAVKGAMKANRIRKAEAAYKASKPNYDAVTRREKIQDAYDFAQRALKRKK